MTFAQQLEQKGLEKGLQQGMQQGMQQGQQQGRTEAKFEFARLLLAEGKSHAEIQRYTDLTVEEINKISS